MAAEDEEYKQSVIRMSNTIEKEARANRLLRNGIGIILLIAIFSFLTIRYISTHPSDEARSSSSSSGLEEGK